MVVSLNTILVAIGQLLFFFGLSPLLVGIIRKVKARFQARQGASIFQPYFDLIKFLMKGSVKSNVASWIFDLSPILNFACVAVAAILLPIFSGETLLPSNLIVFIYLFAIGRFLMTLSGLDAGSAFGGLGSSREMLLAGIIEPAMIILCLFLAVSPISGLDVHAIFLTTTSNWPLSLLSPQSGLAALALFIIILAEMKRIPFDNPATHLELTMVHEAMILENSGPNLALMEWSNWTKMFLFFALFTGLFLPLSSYWSSYTSVALVLLSSMVLSILVASIESMVVKVRLFRVPELLTFALICALLAFLSSKYPSSGGSKSIEILLSIVMLLSSVVFLLSANLMRRLKLFFIGSLSLCLILSLVALSEGSFDTYFRLGSAVLLKLVVAPILLLMIFKSISEKSKSAQFNVSKKISHSFSKTFHLDPISLAPASSFGPMVLAGLLILLSFVISNIFGLSNILFPISLSIIFIGLLILTVKTHLLLQLFGLLILENGIVLLSLAVPSEIPFVGEATALMDGVILVSVAVALILKTKETSGTLDSRELSELSEKR
ncbi:NADH-quinone oxidoreductase subunit H [Candidatus Micrarchaeota archaeon]|nr:NADH-quinone oxidoreductase subunit H [Candidatus Micrarchaeota archaeon]